MLFAVEGRQISLTVMLQLAKSYKLFYYNYDLYIQYIIN